MDKQQSAILYLKSLVSKRNLKQGTIQENSRKCPKNGGSYE